jgi:iron complex outermembrane receptor protein
MLLAVFSAAIPGHLKSEEAVRLAPVVVTTACECHPLEIVSNAKMPVQPIPAHDGADALKCIPGFCVIRKGGADGDPILRGMAGSRLGVLLDGAAIFGGCGNRMDPPTAYVFPSAYDHITILKGPQTVLYGPGNSAGVVLFECEPRRFDTPGATGFASMTAGSFGRFDAVVDARAGVPDYFGRVALTRAESGDYEDGSGRSVHGRSLRWSANGTLGWTPDAQTQLELSAARSDGKAAYADRAMDGVKFARDNLALRFRRKHLSPVVDQIEAQLYRNYVDHVMDNYSLRPFVPTAMMPGRSVSNPDRLTTGGKAQATLATGAAVRSTLGLDLQANRHTMRSTSNETTSPFEVKARTRDADFRQWGLFDETTYTFAPSQRLIAGLRVDRWQAQDHRATIATSMMATAPNPTAERTREVTLASGFARYEHDLGAAPTTCYLGLGHIERFPDYWEMFKNESIGSVSAFGTRPEETTQLDTGLIFRRGSLDFSIAAYCSDVTGFNLVQSNVAKPSGMTGTRLAVITRNIDASTWGGETGLDWRFAERWKLGASLAYVQGTNQTDHRPLAQIPPFESRLSLDYLQTRWSVGGLVRAVAAQDRVAVNQGNIVGQDIGPSPGFAIVSLHAAWQPARYARVYAGVDNLLDQTYAEHISRAGAMVAGYAQTTRVNEPGRTFWAKVEFTY